MRETACANTRYGRPGGFVELRRVVASSALFQKSRPRIAVEWYG